MLIEDLEAVLEELAPVSAAEPWDNVGLLVGRRGNEARKVLVALDASEDVIVEAVTSDVHAVIAHHPLIFGPLLKVADDTRVGVLVQQLIAADVALFACHTNLDSAPQGLSALVAADLGLVDVKPLRFSPARHSKFVGFVPLEALPKVRAAVFAEGAGHLGLGAYEGCAWSVAGEGEFLPREGANPAIGRVGVREQVSEVRWETVVPEGRVTAVIRAYLAAHPYEEPAFDVYPAEDVMTSCGLGRVGCMRVGLPLVSFAETVAEMFGLDRVQYVGDPGLIIDRVAVVTGSGASLIDDAARVSDVLVTGDLKYHDAERALDAGVSVVCVPHHEMETWAMRAWTGLLAGRLAREEVTVHFARASESPWKTAFRMEAGKALNGGDLQLFDLEVAEGLGPSDLDVSSSEDESGEDDRQTYLLRVDGGSRGNPGPSAIGIVLEDAHGVVLEEIGARIGHATNNVAEYQALITGLETALDRNARRVRIHSDSELLVRQLRQEYKVKSPDLKELFLQASGLIHRFDRVEIRHVPREDNQAADKLVNLALDGKL